MVGAIINIIIMIPLLLLAITLSKGKGAFLIAGYNTMSEEEKAKWDEIALCKFMGKIMYGVAFSLLLLTLSELVKHQIFFIGGMILCIGLPIFAVIYSNAGKRFKKEVVDE